MNRVAASDAELRRQFLRHCRENLLGVGRTPRLEILPEQPVPYLPAEQSVSGVGHSRNPPASGLDEPPQVGDQGHSSRWCGRLGRRHELA